MHDVLVDIFLKCYGFFLVYLLAAYELIIQFIWLYRYRKGILPGPDESKFAQSKTILITGGLRGIGFEVVKKCLKHKNRVIIIGSQSSAEAEKKLEVLGSDVHYIQTDLRDLKQVKKTCEELVNKQLVPDVLLFNAAIMHAPFKLVDGMESQLLTSYLSHCLILSELRDHLGPESRIIFTSSVCHKAGYLNLDDIHGKKSYSGHLAYVQAKLLQVILTKYLSPKLNIISLHPGVVDTELYQFVWMRKLIAQFCFMNIEEAALCPEFACLSSEMDGKSGCYLEYSEVARPSAKVNDEALQQKVFDATVEMLKPYTDFSKVAR